jgi:hypothetical protein
VPGTVRMPSRSWSKCGYALNTTPRIG